MQNRAIGIGSLSVMKACTPLSTAKAKQERLVLCHLLIGMHHQVDLLIDFRRLFSFFACVLGNPHHNCDIYFW